MANRRSFLRRRGGEEEFAEITWTRRAIEVAQGVRGTPGHDRGEIFRSEPQVEEAVLAEVRRLVAEGFVEQAGGASLRVDPATFAATLVEQRHLRTCAVPDFRPGSGARSGSRRGGLPWLAARESWPRCGACSKPLRFVLQVALCEVATVPGPLPREGLLQLFACDSDCYYRDGWEPFSATNLARVVATSGGAVAELPSEVADDADFLVPESGIERWTLLPDAPGPQAIAAETGVDFDTALEAREQLEAKGVASRWEKIGGWPTWAQAEQVVTCRSCAAGPMAVAMQLRQTLLELDVLRGNSLYVVCCPACGALTTVQQR